MMEKDKLRKADIFSGGVFFLFGLWIMSQALKMPMKDSWGGVQNVWFVSPAIFPLFVGAVIMLLGAMLARTAIKTVGLKGLTHVFSWLGSQEFARFLKTDAIMRFYAIAVLLFCFVFLNIPRIDFFLCSVLFLAAFITMFYLDDDAILKKLLRFYLAGTVFFILYFIFKLPDALAPILPWPNDWLAFVFIAAYCIYTWTLIRNVPTLRRKYRTSLILAVASPFIIGSIFKYLLLVPMPTEGLVVVVMDAIRYFEY